MAIYDPHFGGYRIFVGDLGRQATRYDIEQEYERYGKLLDVWVARNPPGFAFIVFKHLDECERAVRKSHGRQLCGRRVRVEYARPFDDRSGKQQPIPSSHVQRSRSRSPRQARRSSQSRSPRKHHRRSRSRERRHSRHHHRRSSRSGSRHRRSSGRTHHHHKSRRYSSRDRSESSSRESSGSHSPSQTTTTAAITSRSHHNNSSDSEADRTDDEEREGSYPNYFELTVKDSV